MPSARLHPADRLTRIRTGMKSTLLAAKSPDDFFKIDQQIQEITALVLEAQVRTLKDPDDDCEDLIAAALRARLRARDFRVD